MLMVYMHIKIRQDGFALHVGIGVVVVVGLIALTGWLVLGRQQAVPAGKSVTGSPTVQKPKPDDATDTGIDHPAGWIKYDYPDSLISFYHPPSWKSADFKLHTSLMYDCIPGGWGTPEARRLNESQGTWEFVLNCGTEDQRIIEQKTDDAWGIKSMTLPRVSAQPIAYYPTGHASVSTHDILVVNKDVVYQLRLPVLNGSDYDNDPGSFEEAWNRQSKAVPDIIRSINFASIE